MRCIFCKTHTDNCVSVEHIIPESLGNIEHVLTKGFVCDNCNQYFAIKIEKPLLELPYFVSVRFRNDIENKKGRFPLDKAFMGGEVWLGKSEEGYFISTDNSSIIKGLQSGIISQMIVPFNAEPVLNNMHVSKFLCKVALESLVYKVKSDPGFVNEIIDHVQLDYLRDYVRRGNKPAFWEYHQRRVYEETDMFFYETVSSKPYEVLHELDFIFSDEGEMFFVLVMMGIEYVISMAAESISGYRKWLIQNAGAIPLQYGDHHKVPVQHYNNRWLGKKLRFYWKYDL